MFIILSLEIRGTTHWSRGAASSSATVFLGHVTFEGMHGRRLLVVIHVALVLHLLALVVVHVAGRLGRWLVVRMMGCGFLFLEHAQNRGLLGVELLLARRSSASYPVGEKVDHVRSSEPNVHRATVILILMYLLKRQLTVPLLSPSYNGRHSE